MEDVKEGKDYNFPAEEQEILRLWDEIDAFKEQLRQTEGRKKYTFYDGPPFATGLPHYGHLLAGTIKVGFLVCCYTLESSFTTALALLRVLSCLQDIVTRYASTTGHYCPRRFGCVALCVCDACTPPLCSPVLLNSTLW